MLADFCGEVLEILERELHVRRAGEGMTRLTAAPVLVISQWSGVAVELESW